MYGIFVRLRNEKRLAQYCYINVLDCNPNSQSPYITTQLRLSGDRGDRRGRGEDQVEEQIRGITLYQQLLTQHPYLPSSLTSVKETPLPSISQRTDV